MEQSSIAVLTIEWVQAEYTVLENETAVEVCFNVSGADSIEGAITITVMTSTKGEPPNSATRT